MLGQHPVMYLTSRVGDILVKMVAACVRYILIGVFLDMMGIECSATIFCTIMVWIVTFSEHPTTVIPCDMGDHVCILFVSIVVVWFSGGSLLRVSII